jgi:hypothetical protein
VRVVLDLTTWANTAMPSFRISLASSLGIVAVIAMGLAGMVSASSLWTTAAATVCLAVLLSAVLASFLLTGIDRAFWAGFALFGWSYLLLVNWDWVGGQFGHDLTAGLSDIAESVFADVAVPGPPQSPATAPAGRAAGGFQSDYLESVRGRQIRLGNFVQIGRMILSLLFGLLGGWIAESFARRREAGAKVPGPPTSGAIGPGAG